MIRILCLCDLGTLDIVQSIIVCVIEILLLCYLLPMPISSWPQALSQHDTVLCAPPCSAAFCVEVRQKMITYGE